MNRITPQVFGVELDSQTRASIIMGRMTLSRSSLRVAESTMHAKIAMQRSLIILLKSGQKMNGTK
jgi:hypothetical protein